MSDVPLSGKATSTLEATDYITVVKDKDGTPLVRLVPATDFATQAALDAAVVGLYDHKGAYNASTNSPDLDTTPSGIKKGDAYTVSVAGTFFAVVLEAGDVLVADQDNPTQASHWTIVNRNIDSSAFAAATHASSHELGGGDAIKLDDLAAPDDNTDLNASTSNHGLLPKLGGGSTNFLRADGTWNAPPSGGLTKFTEAESTSSPNATVYVDSLTAAGASTNADFAIVPKGTGAIVAAVPNSASSGGNKRGANAVDLQTKRSASSQVSSGAYSVVCGGERNTSSGGYCVAAGGYNNLVNGDSAVVSGGAWHVSSGNNTTICGGIGNTVTGDFSTVIGGYNNTASGDSSVAGGRYATANKAGQFAIASGFFANSGDAQTSVLVARKPTTDATPAELFLDGSSARCTLANDTTWAFTITVVARRTDANDESAAYKFEGCIDRNASAATTAIVGSVTKTVLAEDTAAWDCDVTADTTNGSLKITVTGEASKTIRWVARIELTEVTG